jgi:hypothetical protein
VDRLPVLFIEVVSDSSCLEAHPVKEASKREAESKQQNKYFLGKREFVLMEKSYLSSGCFQPVAFFVCLLYPVILFIR